MPGSYTVGLPVTITVHEDGAVEYTVDTAEAGVALIDYAYDMIEDEIRRQEALADVPAVEADHVRRRWS